MPPTTTTTTLLLTLLAGALVWAIMTAVRESMALTTTTTYSNDGPARIRPSTPSPITTTKNNELIPDDDNSNKSPPQTIASPSHSARSASRIYGGLSLEQSESIPPDFSDAIPKNKLAGALYFCRKERDALLKDREQHDNTIFLPTNSQQQQQQQRIRPSSSCSSPYHTLKPSSMNDDVDTITDIIHVSYCLHSTPEQLSGTFRIEKKTNCTSSSPDTTTYSQDATWRSWVEAKFGSEEFVLTLQGPEILPLFLHQRHLGNCIYELPFQARIPGKYHVELQWSRHSYLSAIENYPGWPPAMESFPLGHGVFITLGSVAALKSANLLHERVLAGKPNLPSCLVAAQIDSTYLTTTSGTWVARHVGPVQFIDELVPQRRGLRRFVTPESYVWVPHHCKLESWPMLMETCLRTTTTTSATTRKKELIVMGDSHGREMFIDLVNALCNATIFESSKVPLFKWEPEFDLRECGKAFTEKYTTLRRIETHQGGEMMEELRRLGGTTTRFTIIGNFAQHLMGQPSSFEMNFVPRIDRLFKLIETLPSRKSNVVWYDAPALPFRRDGFVRGSKDGRTLQRVYLWNRHVRERLGGELGTPIVPLFDMTLPFWTSFPDLAHYPAQVMEVAARIGVVLSCANDE